jgi:hypothetical protein
VALNAQMASISRRMLSTDGSASVPDFLSLRAISDQCRSAFTADPKRASTAWNVAGPTASARSNLKRACLSASEIVNPVSTIATQFDLDQSRGTPRVAELRIGSRGSLLQMEFGNMMVLGAAAVAMTVFLVTLFTVAWVTEHRKQ